MAISVNRLIGITMPTYYEKGYGFNAQTFSSTIYSGQSYFADRTVILSPT